MTTTIGELAPPRPQFAAAELPDPSLGDDFFFVDCAKAQSYLQSPLLFLPTQAGLEGRCFIDATFTTGGDKALPAKDEYREAGVLYLAPDVDVSKATLRSVLDAGGILVAGTVQPPEGPRAEVPTTADPNAPGGGIAPVRVGDARGFVRRVNADRVFVLWPGADSLDGRALDWTCSSNRSPDQVFELANSLSERQQQ